MPLTRATVTAASRIMLPAYVVLCLIFGVAYIFDPGNRLEQAPSITFQRAILPLWTWGAIMLTLAALMLGAFRTKSRLTFAYALCCCAITWALWGIAIAVSIFLTPNTSWLAPALPWFVSVCCIASLASLVTRET
jgi:hypothetical protein